ncbi:MAG: hypothetical protein ACI9EF_000902 [Pseudohongiellaceae bacterium]|jgi:hypothetical protein
MKHLRSTYVVLLLAGLGHQAVGQDYVPRLPDGVGVATVGYAVIDSGTDQYNNSGNARNKVGVTGFGPLLQAAFNLQSGLAFGVPTAPAMDFNAMKLRTRGEVYGAAYTHGVSEDVTVSGRFRMGNMRTDIRHTDDPAFAQVQTALAASGFEGADDAHMNDRLISADIEAAFWLDDEYLNDDTKHESAIIVGYSHRGSWRTGGHNLVEFALSDLARMNRPDFLRFGFQGKLIDDYDGVDFTYGAQLNYHMSGSTREVNPAIVLSNAANASGLIPIVPSKTPIEGVDSVSHYGYTFNLAASMPLDEERATRVGIGFWMDYEAGYSLHGVGFSNSPIGLDSQRNTKRQAQSRGYVRLNFTHSTIQAFQDGFADLPYVLSLQIDDSIYGRNQSELQIATLRFSVPLTRANS